MDDVNRIIGSVMVHGFNVVEKLRAIHQQTVAEA